MKLICALILWQVLLQVSKEDNVPAETNQIDKQGKDMENNNNQTQILMEELIGVKRELESKNKHIKYLEEIQTELRNELKSKCDPVGMCSMPTVRGELIRQQGIMEKLEKNLGEKQQDEINKVLKDFYSKSKNLEHCEKELTSQENTIEAKDKKINQLEEKVKELISQLQEVNPRSCIESLSSGLQYITLPKGYTFKVLCNSDIAGPGWIVIQQRIDGKVDFYRNWDTYRDGFGDIWDGEFFLGLEKIHRLTAEEPHELYIHMERFDGGSYYARYDEFAIAGEDDQFELIKLGPFSGSTKNNMMRDNKYKKFSTYDRDNDASDRNCAEDHQGAWWYGNCICSWRYGCFSTNLNGRYYSTHVWDQKVIYWEGFTSLKQVKMMIRPKVTLK